MFRASKDSKILKTIVQLVLVDVVNHLMTRQLSSDCLFDKHSMFAAIAMVSLAPGNRNLPISVLGDGFTLAPVLMFFAALEWMLATGNYQTRFKESSLNNSLFAAIAYASPKFMSVLAPNHFKCCQRSKSHSCDGKHISRTVAQSRFSPTFCTAHRSEIT